jgi:hypothetical protein
VFAVMYFYGIAVAARAINHIDSLTPLVCIQQALPMPNSQCNSFEAYWNSVGLNLEEGLALLGSHCVADSTNRSALAASKHAAELCTDHGIDCRALL